MSPFLQLAWALASMKSISEWSFSVDLFSFDVLFTHFYWGFKQKYRKLENTWIFQRKIRDAAEETKD